MSPMHVAVLLTVVAVGSFVAGCITHAVATKDAGIAEADAKTLAGRLEAALASGEKAAAAEAKKVADDIRAFFEKL